MGLSPGLSDGNDVPYVLDASVRRCQRLRSRRSSDDADAGLDVVLHRLETIPDFTVKTVELTGHPLPTPRPRIFFIGSRVPEHPAAKLVDAIEELNRHVGSWPTHHLKSFLEAKLSDADAGAGEAAPMEVVDEAKHEEDYAQYFNTGLRKAIERGRLPKKACLPARTERVSWTHAALKPDRSPKHALGFCLVQVPVKQRCAIATEALPDVCQGYCMVPCPVRCLFANWRAP